MYIHRRVDKVFPPRLRHFQISAAQSAAVLERGVFSVGSAEVTYVVEPASGRSARLRFEGDTLVVRASRGSDPREIISKNWRWVYRNHAKMRRTLDEASVADLEQRGEDEFKRLVCWLADMYSRELGVSHGKIAFRLLRSKWGSCSSTRRISFNLALRHLPERLVRYVVYHEVSHLAELNHGKAFWRVVARRFPDRGALEDELLAYWFVVSRIYDF
jgi:hypothetical protein